MTVDPRITALIEAGLLREQCAHCEHAQEYHETTYASMRCGVCFAPCNYQAAFTLRTPKTALGQSIVALAFSLDAWAAIVADMRAAGHDLPAGVVEEMVKFPNIDQRYFGVTHE